MNSAEYLSSGDSLYARVLDPETGSPRSSAGEGTQTLVLLHPTPLDHRFWLPVADELVGYRRILPDLRGHGRSPLGSAPSLLDPAAPVLTIEQLAGDLVALLDTLEVKKAVFVGCSIGGYTLYELWRIAPKRVSGLVFCASKPQGDNDAERAKRGDWIARMEPARLAASSRPTPEFIEAMLTALLSEKTRRERPGLVAAVRLMMEQVEPGSVQAIQRGLGRRPDARATARTVSVPSCVIAGAEDASSTPADLSALHSMLKQAGASSSYHLLADAGHYGPFEQPSTVAGIVDTFCQSLHG